MATPPDSGGNNTPGGDPAPSGASAITWIQNASYSGYAEDKDWSYSASAMETYEEALSEFSDKWGYTSYPCSPTTWVEIPEVKKTSVEFIYNFYTKNERTSGAGTFDVLDINNMTQEDEAIARADRYPRFNQIYISPTTFDTDDESLKGVAKKLGPNLIKDYFNYVQSEDTISTAFFSAVHIKDDFIDREFYDSLASSISFFGLPDNTSGNTDASNLCEVVDDQSVFSPDGLQMKDALSNVQAQGVAYAPSDTRSEITNNAFTSVTNLDFGFNLNNLVVKNLIESSLEDKSNIYENELRSLLPSAKTIQESAIESVVPGTITSDEYEVTISGAFEQTAYDAESVDSFVNEHSLPVGYIVEKFEIRQRGDTWERIEHDPIIVEHYGTMNLLDLDIRYGGTYIYNVKTVCLTRIEAFRVDNVDDVEDQAIFAVILVASAGLSVKIDCTENIPPNPPQNLSFYWDYKEDGLILFWEEELNPQRDVVRYQIFRRKSVSVPFTLIQELDFDNSTSRVVPLETAPDDLITRLPGPRKLFRDLDFTKSSDYIYTLAAIDARGFTSNYSAQFRVTFDSSRNKLHVDLVSQSGTPKSYPNIYLNQDLFVDTMKDSGHSRMRIFFDPEYSDVFLTKSIDSYDAATGTPTVIKNEEFLDLLADKYKLQIINVDNQLSEIIDLSINNESGPPMAVPLSRANISFFGFDNV